MHIYVFTPLESALPWYVLLKGPKATACRRVHPSPVGNFPLNSQRITHIPFGIWHFRTTATTLRKLKSVMDSDNKSTKSARSGDSRGSGGFAPGGSRRTMSLRRIFKSSEGTPLESPPPMPALRPSILPASAPSRSPERRIGLPPSNIPAPARPLVGGVPSAFTSLGMAAYVIPTAASPAAEPKPSPSLPNQIPRLIEQKSPLIQVAVELENPPKPIDPESNISEYFEQRAGWSRVMGRNVLEKRRGSVTEGEQMDNAAFVLSYSTVEIDYINGHTIQALTWQPGGITFIRLTPTTVPLPPLLVPYSCSVMDAPFYVTIHLSNSTKKELLHIDSEIEYKTLLRRIGAHYDCNIVGEDGTSAVGLGLSTKAWNGPDTRKWAQKLEALEDLDDQDEEYMEMILSVDTASKWAWCLGIARQALKVRGLTSSEMRRVGVEMWLINEEGDNFSVMESP